jgi:hypothetical protein
MSGDTHPPDKPPVSTKDVLVLLDDGREMIGYYGVRMDIWIIGSWLVKTEHVIGWREL